MTNTVSIRFESPEGGVSLMFNGFVLIGSDEVGRSGSQAAPYMRTGENRVELISERPGASATATVVEVGEASPDEAPVLATLSVEGEGAAEAVFEISDNVPSFGWHRAAPITDLDSHRSALYRGLVTLADRLSSGPDEKLVAMLSMKHNELSDSMGVAVNVIDEGLVEGLKQLRLAPGFKVNVVPEDEFLPLLSSDKTIVSARATGGGDAITIIDGISNPGFSVALARIDERWTIVR